MKKLILTLLLASFCGLGASSAVFADEGENTGGSSGQETCPEKTEESTSQS
ncbi:hypothetical protein [Chlamydia gallinacea]|uniref:hypothetical protein n=1 Tax=Chlamydia gallinacea TaxID=1457153 RepID=UPI00255CF9B5|nr:hypothetical protein [Chlamydia gallinacea]